MFIIKKKKGGSTTSEVNAEAARYAAEEIKSRIANIKIELWKKGQTS